MPDIKNLFDAEMRRVARKEVKELKDTIASQQKIIKELTKRLDSVEKQLASATTTRIAIPTQQSVPKTKKKNKRRFSANMIREFCKKYFITQETLAKLLGVSAGTIEHWLAEKSTPNEERIEAFLALAKLGHKQLFALIEEKAPEAFAGVDAITPMRFDQQSFIKSFLEFRKRTSISQETIAKLLGTQKRTVTSWERGKSVPKFVLVQKFYALEKLSQEELYALMAEKAPKALATLKKVNERENGLSYQRDLLSIRKRYSISQKTLAALLGVAKRTVNLWESGNATPKAETKKAIKNLAKLDRQEMMNLIAEKAPNAYALLKKREAKMTLASTVESETPKTASVELPQPTTTDLPTETKPVEQSEPVASESVEQPKPPEPVRKNPGPIVLTVTGFK